MGQHVVELVAFREQLAEPVAPAVGVATAQHGSEGNRYGEDAAIHPESGDAYLRRGEVEGSGIAFQGANPRSVETNRESHRSPRLLPLR